MDYNDNCDFLMDTNELKRKIMNLSQSYYILNQYEPSEGAKRKWPESHSQCLPTSISWKAQLLVNRF